MSMVEHKEEEAGRVKVTWSGCNTGLEKLESRAAGIEMKGKIHDRKRMA